MMSHGQERLVPWQGKKATLLRWGAVLFPCALLLQLSHELGVDWLNNVWMVSHTAAHLRQHGSFPPCFNTEELGGLPQPVFYGYLVYPLLGAAAVCLGAPATVRLAILAVWSLQFFQVRRVLRRSGTDDNLATVVACLVIWAIYPLTNVYCRGALGEVFASGLLTCAVCQWFTLLLAEMPGERLRSALAVGLFYSLAAGCHPITALYGLAFLLGLAPTLLFRAGPGEVRSRCRALLPAACLTGLVLAPWVFACLRFRKALVITKYCLYLYPDNLDLWWSRLFPLPLDVRTWTAPDLNLVSVPFLDAQVNVPLLLLAGAVVWGLLRGSVGPTARRGLWWLVLPALGAGLCLWMSLDTRPYHLLPADFQSIQFPYRMVSYFNLALLIALLLAVRVVGPTGGTPRRSPSPTLLTLVLALAGVGVFIKLIHVPQLAAHPRLKETDLPYTLYGHYAYATPFSVQQVTKKDVMDLKKVRLPLERGGSSDRYLPTVVELDRPGFVAVQIQVFPWNRFFLDGRPVPAEDMRCWHGNISRSPAGWDCGPYSVIRVPAGRHLIEHRYVPDVAWVWLFRGALGVIVLWSLGLTLLWVWKGWEGCASGAGWVGRGKGGLRPGIALYPRGGLWQDLPPVAGSPCGPPLTPTGRRS
jgi:hypothetical protein